MSPEAITFSTIEHIVADEPARVSGDQRIERHGGALRACGLRQCDGQQRDGKVE